MLDLKGLCEMLVVDASERGATANAILAEVTRQLIPLRKKEQTQRVEELAKGLTLKHVEDALGDAMSEQWNDNELCDLDEAMKIRFPKHHKAIEKIWGWAGDASNEREESCRHGASNEFERLYGRVEKALKKLPW